MNINEQNRIKREALDKLRELVIEALYFLEGNGESLDYFPDSQIKNKFLDEERREIQNVLDSISTPTSLCTYCKINGIQSSVIAEYIKTKMLYENNKD